MSGIWIGTPFPSHAGKLSNADGVERLMPVTVIGPT